MQPPMGGTPGPIRTPDGTQGPWGDPPPPWPERAKCFAERPRGPARERADDPATGQKGGPSDPAGSAERHDRPCDRGTKAGYAAALSRLLRTRGGTSLLALPWARQAEAVKSDLRQG